jgi:peptidyl-prolyl cis-trans isomerase SurA
MALMKSFRANSPLSSRFALVIMALLAAFAPATAAHAQDQGIVAVVNDAVISQHDLNARMALFLATSNLPDTPDNRRRLAPEVLRALIDDTLKRQEMRRQNISVSQAELDRALAQIAEQLRIEPAQLPAFLASRGVTMSALIDQLQAEIGWVRAVTRIAGDRAVVSAQEVDEEENRIKGSAAAPSQRLAEIFLSVDDPSDQARIEDLAVRLVAEARGGANFAGLARTFSQGPSAASGGDLGWVPIEELDTRIQTVVTRMQPGEVSDPIRAQGGYFILHLIGRRAGGATSSSKLVVSVQQLFVPLPTAVTDAELRSRAASIAEISQGAGSCTELAERSRQVPSAMTRNTGLIDIQQLPSELRPLVQPLAVGQVTPPVRATDGFLVLMMCERTEEQSTEQREQIERRLREQRLSAVSRRQLRDLRRAALLDIRT